MLIACPTCGRLQFDMDTVVAEIEQRLEAYEEPIEVAVLGCAVNGIGEASHADFGITGAKNEGLIFSRGKPLRKVPTEQLVDDAVRGDRQVRRLRREADRRRRSARPPRAPSGSQAIEDENAGEMTPERLAALEKAKQAEEADEMSGALLETVAERSAPRRGASPTAGRRFTRT